MTLQTATGFEPISITSGCSTDPFSNTSPLHPHTTQPYYEFLSGNLYYYLVEMKQLLDDWRSHFWLMSHDNAKFEAVIDTTDSLGGDSGGFTFNGGSLGGWTLTLNQSAGSVTGGQAVEHANRLDTIAHEYGHYVAGLYGASADISVGEGLAETYVLRYAIHKKFGTGEWADLEYGDYLVPTNHRVLAAVVHGLVEPAGGDYEFFPGPFCGAMPNVTKCRSLVFRLYWELAWNQCRSPFDDCDYLQQILPASVVDGANTWFPWNFVNLAYAFALTSLVAGDEIDDFFDLVAAGMTINWNLLTQADLDRVHSVMARHCVGPTHTCGSGHNLRRLPGHTLAVQQTDKAKFQDPVFNSAHFLYVTNDMDLGELATTAFGTDDGLSYVSLGSQDQIAADVEFPAEDDYIIDATVSSGVGQDTLHTLELLVDGNVVNVWDILLNDGAWVWEQSPLIHIEAGVHQIAVQNVGDPIGIEALVLRAP